ncbi:MAG: MBL fold metallo-hydrolase [Chloroflexota bacterium]
MQVSPHVRAVQVPDENPMHPQYTNIYIVEGERRLVIDSGEAMDRYKWMLRGYLAATGSEQASMLAITHHHFDHAGNLEWAVDTLKAQVALPQSSIKLLKGKLPKDNTTLHILEDGEVIDLGGVSVRVIFTPGHTVDSVCYYIEAEGVLFTGDTMLGGSTTTVSDLAAYRTSLRMLADLPGLETICPGHGPIMSGARQRILDLLAHRESRDRQIVGALTESTDPIAAWDIMLKVYPGLDKRLRRAATGNVVTHLKAMQAEGSLREQPGKPRKANSSKLAKDREKAKQRAKLIKDAEKARADERKERMRAQETPPDDQWVVPPKFELLNRN